MRKQWQAKPMAVAGGQDLDQAGGRDLDQNQSEPAGIQLRTISVIAKWVDYLQGMCHSLHTTHGTELLVRLEEALSNVISLTKL